MNIVINIDIKYINLEQIISTERKNQYLKFTKG